MWQILLRKSLTRGARSGVADFRDDREPLFCRLVLGLGAGTMRAMQVRPHLTLTLHT